ncbi:TolC family protein [Pedobacter sp. MC2016-05]|uniref:TolC family protein n=1 Tax=Pedobacter sp. MC2016-05 TaxID=2994474 RepID=UPI0022486869|nr:TolC family protein [Pedobacter sp. MC2016-05]MCX2475344.1 TolC family protein [Pedobacter sp. MC2016-05]
MITAGRVNAQTDSVLRNAKLEDVINYALKNKPGVKQSYLDQEVGERDIKSALSAWLPQINADGSFNHNIKQQLNALTVDGQTSYIVFGTKNTSSLILQADQQFLNAGLIQASKSARYYRQQYRQNTENVQINTIVDVSKAFYDILTSQEQLKIIEENIARINKQLKDAKSQYEAGLVDKTDYQRAQISLSNSSADKKRTSELLKSKYAYLKALMGYSAEKELTLSFDNQSMESGILIDTVQTLDYQKRVEYRLLQTQRSLQSVNTSYNKLAYLPKLSGFINYSFNYLGNDVSEMFKMNLPGSIVGLRLNIPIFQGTKRIQEIRKAQLLEKRTDLDLQESKNQINSQYERAMATYKAGLNDWKTARSNVDVSKQVYGTIKLQYDEGIKSYLDLMTAETDLKTSQINYLNALYGVLSAKLDVQQALGTISTTP